MFQLADFIASCHTRAQAEVERLVSRALADPAALRAALGEPSLGDPPAAQYVILHQSPQLTIMQVCVPPDFRSPPHNHLAWAVIGLYQGAERNTLFRRGGAGIVATETIEVDAPGVLALGAEAIHAIANPLAQPSLALHVYGGTLANEARSLWDPFTGAELPFRRDALSRLESALNPKPAGTARH